MLQGSSSIAVCFGLGLIARVADRPQITEPGSAASAAVGDAVAHRDTSALVQTDTLVYVFRSSGPAIEATIPFTYRNPLSDTLYIVNCRGSIAAAFERQRGISWERFWAPVVQACLSPPIAIPPGATGNATIHGVRPGQNAMPEQPLGDLTATYRLVLSEVVFHYTSQGGTFGMPVPLMRRSSNELILPGGFGNSDRE